MTLRQGGEARPGPTSGQTDEKVSRNVDRSNSNPSALPKIFSSQTIFSSNGCYRSGLGSSSDFTHFRRADGVCHICADGAVMVDWGSCVANETD